MRGTVLIVDDHAPYRRLARRLLEAGGFTVVGEAADGRSALAAATAVRPEVVLLDVLLPDLDGFAVARQLAALDEPPLVVLTSSRDRVELGARLTQTPAAGFLQKDELSAERLAALARAP
jgi:two-component system nitrate/nitrite response regulator NarL